MWKCVHVCICVSVCVSCAIFRLGKGMFLGICIHKIRFPLWLHNCRVNPEKHHWLIMLLQIFTSINYVRNEFWVLWKFIMGLPSISSELFSKWKRSKGWLNMLVYRGGWIIAELDGYHSSRNSLNIVLSSLNKLAITWFLKQAFFVLLSNRIVFKGLAVDK